MIVAAATFVACSLGADKETAERAVEEFHEHFNEGRYSAIYAIASLEFRQTTSEVELIELLQEIRRKLGEVTSARAVGVMINAGPRGTRVVLTYETTFSEGPASEEFVWGIRDKRVELLGYHVRSQLLTR